MRIVFIGTSSLTLSAAYALLEAEHTVVIIERDEARINELSEQLEAGFIHGDATSPDVLTDAEPENTDVLFSLLESDQTNILASLIGRSLGFKRVVPRVNNPQFQRICNELGLQDSIMPNRAVASHLKDMLRGDKSLELSSLIRGEAMVFDFKARDRDAVSLDEIELPQRSRIICLYRDDAFLLPEQTTELKASDEVILISPRDNLDTLQEHWGTPQGHDDSSN
jgi:trk system potassium uptake protein TrkA